ncbi:MAG: PAS domain S-box protein [Thermoanaerobaculia bacterium]|nr:PAS domain S-box protein [Thermoanaerobaculia bacterium]
MNTHFSIPAEWGEEVLREIFRHTPIGVVLSDLHGQIFELNDAMASMLGYPRSEFLGAELFRFFAAGEAPLAEVNMSRLRNGEVGSVEVMRSLVHRDGSTVHAKLTASVVRSRTGEPICGLGLFENVTSRVLADQVLRESEAAHRDLVEAQSDMIVRGKIDGTRLFVNEAYCRFMGRSREELLRESFLPVIHDNDRAALERDMAALTPDNPIRESEHRMIGGEGVVRWHHWTSRGFFDSAGRLSEIQAVGRDITEEREAQELLRNSEENYRRLYQALPVAVWESDMSQVIAECRRRGIDTPEKLIEAVKNDPAFFGALARNVRPVNANEAAFTMTGASSLPGILQWLIARYTPEAQQAYVRGAAELLLGDSPVVEVEVPLCTPEGERVDLLQRLARSPDWYANPRLMAINLNVTERRRIERELAHRTQVLEEAEVLAKIGSWEWDPSADRLYGSAGFWRIAEGSSHARLSTFEDTVSCIHPDDRETLRQRIDTLLQTGHDVEGGAETDIRLVHQDGTVLVGRGVGFAERDSSGKTLRIIGVLLDVTEQRRIEQSSQREREALTRADKMISLGVLVAGVAHEINNPNHYITLNAPLLRGVWRDVQPILEEFAAATPDFRIANLPWDEMRTEVPAIIDEIALGADRIASIVAELRRFGRDSGSGSRKPVFLNDVVGGSMRLLATHIRKATGNFSLELASDLPPVLGDAQRLQQVVVNLVLNACQALPSADRLVRVSTLRENGSVLLRVEDEGSGIPGEILDKITDPFFTTKRSSGGTGLGLAVSDRIVKEHDGELRFDSKVDTGTIVTVIFPPMGVP